MDNKCLIVNQSVQRKLRFTFIWYLKVWIYKENRFKIHFKQQSAWSNYESKRQSNGSMFGWKTQENMYSIPWKTQQDQRNPLLN